MISGRQSLVGARALDATELLEIDLADLRHIVQTDTELSELFLRAFALRRAHLIANDLGGAVLIGSGHSADTLRLKAFLGRNGHPYVYLDVERDSERGRAARALPDRPRGHPGADVPGPGPGAAQSEQCGGGGRARLQQRASTKGTCTTSSWWARGPPGSPRPSTPPRKGSTYWYWRAALPAARRARAPASRTTSASPWASPARIWQAARFSRPRSSGRIWRWPGWRRDWPAATGGCASRAPTAGSVQGNAVVVATGAAYRKLTVPELGRFEGNGVYYGATRVEAQLCDGEEIVVVGGGNSAGQAAVFLSGIARHVHLLVRGAGLADSMSRYLIRRIEESPAITLRPHTQIEALEGDGRLQRVCWRSADAADREVRDIRHVFSMTGADANTRWLGGCLALDEQRFVKTGADLSARGARGRAVAPEAPAVSVRDQPAPGVRGWRRPVGEHEARGVRGGRGLGRGAARPQGPGRVIGSQLPQGRRPHCSRTRERSFTANGLLT